MHTKGGSPVAFVEYQDVRYAAQAMATLQGSFLLSSDRGAIRIEYAKSKMAEVGFTNLWIEVGSTLCYDRLLQKDAGGGGRLYLKKERDKVLYKVFACPRCLFSWYS